MRKPSLIPNWRRSLNFWSVRIAALGVVWGSLPVETQTAMLAAIGIEPTRVPAILGALFIVFRLVAQPEKPTPPTIDRQPWAGS
jgi:hypothetical protein